MTMLINVAGKKLVAGMRWIHPGGGAVLPGKAGRASKASSRASGQRAAAAAREKQLAKEHRAVYAAGSALGTWGYLSAFDVKQLGSLSMMAKLYSVAEMFSLVPDLPVTAILVTGIPGTDDFVMCTAVKGHPAPGDFDVVVNRREVVPTLQRWFDQLKSASGSEGVVYGTWESARHRISLEELVAASPAATPLRKIGAEQGAVRNLMVVAAIGAAGYLGYDEWERYQAVQAAQSAPRANPEQIYQKALQEQWPAQSWSGVARVRAMLERVSAIPRDVGGFRLSTDVTCDLAEAKCVFQYKRIDGVDGTFDTFRKAAHGAFVPVSFGQDGSTVEVMLLADLPTTKVPDIAGLGKEEESPFLYWPTIQEQLPSLVKGTMQSDFKTFPQAVPISEASVPTIVRSVGVTLAFPLWAANEMPPRTGVFENSINWKRVTVNPVSTEVNLTGEMYATKVNQ